MQKLQFYGFSWVRSNSFQNLCFCRIKGDVIIKCPHIDNEVMDGFVTHVGQKMLDKDSIEQPQQREN